VASLRRLESLRVRGPTQRSSWIDGVASFKKFIAADAERCMSYMGTTDSKSAKHSPRSTPIDEASLYAGGRDIFLTASSAARSPIY
jgi:hypothetical protein